MCGGRQHVDDAVSQRGIYRAAVAALVIAGIVSLSADLLTKAWALRALGDGLSPLVPGVLSTILVHNTGASFGLLASQPWVVTALALAVVGLVVVLWWVEARDSVVASAAVGLIIGGALGNLRDRLAFGHVIDFLHLDFLPWWPVFNVADAATVLGVAVLAVWLVLRPLRAGGGQ